MTQLTRVSAPGKLVVLGEYAVLFGAPAAVMAVNRRAVVTADAAPGEGWSVDAPGLVTKETTCTVSESGRIDWNVAEAGARADRPKLGLGSSAALTVALASALVGPRPDPCSGSLDWLRTMVEVHRAVQGGLGSGIDVAASLCGGVVGYQLDAGGSVAGIAPMRWPDQIVRLCVWTGRPASTRSFIDQLQASRAVKMREVDNALDRLGRVSEGGVDALARNDPFRFLDAVDRFWEGLEALGRVIDMPIVSEAHSLLRKAAEECGVHYKPSGAGGGDFGVCFGTEGDRIRDFSRRVTEAGFAVPDVDLDPSGAVFSGM